MNSPNNNHVDVNDDDDDDDNYSSSSPCPVFLSEHKILETAEYKALVGNNGRGGYGGNKKQRRDELVAIVDSYKSIFNSAFQEGSSLHHRAMFCMQEIETKAKGELTHVTNKDLAVWFVQVENLLSIIEVHGGMELTPEANAFRAHFPRARAFYRKKILNNKNKKNKSKRAAVAQNDENSNDANLGVPTNPPPPPLSEKCKRVLRRATKIYTSCIEAQSQSTESIEATKAISNKALRLMDGIVDRSMVDLVDQFPDTPAKGDPTSPNWTHSIINAADAMEEAREKKRRRHNEE